VAARCIGSLSAVVPSWPERNIHPPHPAVRATATPINPGLKWLIAALPGRPAKQLPNAASPVHSMRYSPVLITTPSRRSARLQTADCGFPAGAITRKIRNSCNEGRQYRLRERIGRSAGMASGECNR
jgi:hypothetical protein